MTRKPSFTAGAKPGPLSLPVGVGKLPAKPSKSKLHHAAAAKGFKQRKKQGYE